MKIRQPAAIDTLSLLDLDRELGHLLTEEEREEVASIRLPLRTFGDGKADGTTSLRTDFEEAEAFGGLVITGILVHEVRLGDRTGMRLLGPGDVIASPSGPDPLVVAGTRWLPAGPVRLAMFDDRLVLALRRWPRLMVGLYARLGQQADRLTAQLLICQLPRVEDRVLAMMWLLAESWGKVTPAGTRLPLDLTHETIGMLIGARRPTVSLALRELAEQGAMVRHGSGWLLLQPTTGMSEPSPDLADEEPGLPRVQVIPGPDLAVVASASPVPEHAAESPAASYALLRETVSTLRDLHQRNIIRFETRLAAIKAARMKCQSTREELARRRVTRPRRSPS